MLRLFIAGQTYVVERYDQLENSEAGQTMAEYGVVLAVIKIGVVVALGFLWAGTGVGISDVTDELPTP